MKKTFKKIIIGLMACILALSCTGCVTGTIYGKPLEDLESVDEGRGLMYMGKIMDAMVGGSVDDINQLGYHYGQEDAETFEDFWASWEEYKPIYGQIESYYLDEAYQYGSEYVFVFVANMEKGEMRVSTMFTEDYELVMLFMYETGEEALARTEMPEEIAEEEIVVGAGTQHPVNGKITYPKDAKSGDALPAVVLVDGDGMSNNMDMKTGNTYLYRDLAWSLAQRGIASIRFDKKGIDYSDELQMEDAPAEDFTVAFEYTDDVLDATRLIREQPYVDSEKVYYIGHSLGAVVAPRIDEAGGDYAGMVLLSSSPRPWYEVAYDQYINYGLVDQESEAIYYLVSKIKAEREFVEKGEYEEMTDEELLENFVLTRSAYYWKDFLSYDYVGKLKEMQKPTLILHGEADFQLLVNVDFAAWQREVGGESWATLKSYEGLNHLLTKSQGCFAGHYKEYDMPGRASEEVLQDIADWILNGTVS